ncbi:MAG: glycosyltransferase, partial [Bacteroidota bacterium]
MIPALNEATGIGATLASVAAQDGPVEVVVIDGGSEDGTPEAARRALPEAVVLTSPRGRATQMNAGAERASGDVLLFLHADTRLPPDALARVRE